MNVRKPTNYSALFAALNTLMAAKLSQMELYREIGRLACGRPGKGAAAVAAEYAQRLSRQFWLLSPEPAADAGFLPHLFKQPGGTG